MHKFLRSITTDNSLIKQKVHIYMIGMYKLDRYIYVYFSINSAGEHL